MPITINDGGVLHELETVTTNVGGVLHELDTVHANVGGVLREIHSTASFPDTLTWSYPSTTAYTPTVSNNGFTVTNPHKDVNCQNIRSNTFDIEGKVKITISITVEAFYAGTGTSGGLMLKQDGSTDAGNSFGVSGNISKSETYEITTGKYYITFSGGQVYQNTRYALKYTINVSFSK